MKEKKVMKDTDDDWYPNFENEQVELRYLGELSDGTFRVAVWGADDCGMERDFILESDAIAMFDTLNSYEKINQSDLEKLDFLNS